jgi:hypothetical protein
MKLHHVMALAGVVLFTTASHAQLTLANTATAPAGLFQTTVGTTHSIDTTNVQIGAASVARTNVAANAGYLPIGTGINPANGFTIQFWVRPTNIGLSAPNANYMLGDPGMIAPTAAGASGGAFRVFADGAAGVGAILVRGVSNQLISPLGMLVNGTWKHLAIRYSPTTNTLSLLVNGVLTTQVVQTTTPFNWSGSNLTVIGYGGSSAPSLSGNYDDYRVYGYARPDADILADYTTVPSGLGTTGLNNVPDKAYYEFNGAVSPHSCVIGTNNDPPSDLDRKFTDGTSLQWGLNSPNQAGNPASCLINIRLGGLDPMCTTPGVGLVKLCHAFSIPSGAALIFPDGLDLNSLGVGAGIPGQYAYGGPAGPSMINFNFPIGSGIFIAADQVVMQGLAIDAAYPFGVGVSNVGKFRYVTPVGLGGHVHVEARGTAAIQVATFYEVWNTGTLDITQVIIDTTTATGGATGFAPSAALNTGGTLVTASSYRENTNVLTGLTGFTGVSPLATTPPTYRGLQFDFTNFTATIDELKFDCDTVLSNLAGSSLVGSTVTVTFSDTSVLTGTMIIDPLDASAAIIDL